MNQFVQSLCSPLTGNFMSATSILVKKQLEDALCNHRIAKAGELINTHTPEFAYFIANKLNKSEQNFQEKQKESFREIIGFINGSSDHITLEIPYDGQGMRILGKAYHESIKICGKLDSLNIMTEKTNITYKSQDFGMLGRRWFDGSAVNTIHIGQDKLPLLVSDGQFYFEKKQPELLDYNVESLRSQLQQSFNILSEVSPEYHLWVILNLREVLPLKRLNPNGTLSGTSLLLPGHIAITNRASVVETINMLVHETSHLFFHILHLSIPLVDNNAPAHFSILKNTTRPLQNILLGYHAFVNVYIVLSMLKSSQFKEALDNELSKNLEHVLKYLQQLEAALNQNKQFLLEQSGLVMFETLKVILKEYKLHSGA